jgi:DNA-directed RNA polymerase specialized sigma24 family protein
LAVLAVKDVPTSEEKISLLNRAGFENQEIADLLATTKGNVAQTLYRGRQKPKKKAVKKASAR